MNRAAYSLYAIVACLACRRVREFEMVRLGTLIGFWVGVLWEFCACSLGYDHFLLFMSAFLCVMGVFMIYERPSLRYDHFPQFMSGPHAL